MDGTQAARSKSSTPVDVTIIGGGPAGLTAAIYLGRFRREFVVFDAGNSRASRIPTSRNVPGFPMGIEGNEFNSRLREQAELYGASVVDDTVHRLTRDVEGLFVAETGSGTVRSRMVLVAAGCVDREPELPDRSEATQNGFMRYCPICDAYEVSGQKVAIIGYGACSLREALLLRGYTDDLTLLTLGRPVRLSDEDRHGLQRAGVRIVEEPVRGFDLVGDAIEASLVSSGEKLRFDAVYSALGRVVRSDLARGLGADADKDGALIVDEHQRTNVPGLYAAGDVVQGLAQISVATGQAAIAATDINNQLFRSTDAEDFGAFAAN